MNFFQIKNIAPEIWMALVAASLLDVEHTSWIQLDQQHLLALGINKFFAQLRGTFLLLDLERTTRNVILNTWQHDIDTFKYFAYSIQSQNCLLLGTDLHMTPEGIKNHLDVHIHASLWDAIHESNDKPSFVIPADGNVTVTLLSWVQGMVAIDEKCFLQWKHTRWCDRNASTCGNRTNRTYSQGLQNWSDLLGFTT